MNENAQKKESKESQLELEKSKKKKLKFFHAFTENGDERINKKRKVSSTCRK
jgi:hypothetical protein